MSYNGFTNWETWNVSLWAYNSTFGEELEEFAINRAKFDDRETLIEKLKAEWEIFAMNSSEVRKGNFHKINYDELVEVIFDNVKEAHGKDLI